MRSLVRALTTPRGIDVVVAISLAAELGELKRFAHPRDLMGYLGLVPSEHSSGQKRSLGSITKTGNGHGRTRSAWRSLENSAALSGASASRSASTTDHDHYIRIIHQEKTRELIGTTPDRQRDARHTVRGTLEWTMWASFTDDLRH
jgi:transposase